MTPVNNCYDLANPHYFDGWNVIENRQLRRAIQLSQIVIGKNNTFEILIVILYYLCLRRIIFTICNRGFRIVIIVFRLKFFTNWTVLEKKLHLNIVIVRRNLLLSIFEFKQCTFKIYDYHKMLFDFYISFDKTEMWFYIIIIICLKDFSTDFYNHLTSSCKCMNCNLCYRM